VSVKALIFQGQKLLVIKNRNEYWGRESQWEIPGGILEIDEEIERGLIREVKEETGFDVSVGKIFAVWDDWQPGFKLKDGRTLDIRIIDIGFICRKTGGKVNLSEEHCQFKWANREELKKLDFAPNSKGAIERYLKQS